MLLNINPAIENTTSDLIPDTTAVIPAKPSLALELGNRHHTPTSPTPPISPVRCSSLLSFPRELLNPLFEDLFDSNIAVWGVLASANFQLLYTALTPLKVCFFTQSLWPLQRAHVIRIMRYGVEKEWITANTQLMFSPEDEYCTPLRFAIESHDYDLIDYLLSKGGDIHLCFPSPNYGLLQKPLLHELIDLNCDGSIIELIIHYFWDDIDMDETWRGLSALHYAALGFDPSEPFSVVPSQLEYLLYYGADPNVKDDNGNTALHYIAEQDLPEEVCRLLFYGADCTIHNRMDLTPRAHACWRQSSDERVLMQAQHPGIVGVCR